MQWINLNKVLAQPICLPYVLFPKNKCTAHVTRMTKTFGFIEMSIVSNIFPYRKSDKQALIIILWLNNGPTLEHYTPQWNHHNFSCGKAARFLIFQLFEASMESQVPGHSRDLKRARLEQDTIDSLIECRDQFGHFDDGVQAVCGQYFTRHYWMDF